MLPDYNEITEDADNYYVWRRSETEVFQIIPWMGLHMELGIDNYSGRLFIRRLIYPKETFTLEEVKRIALKTVSCPKCKEGVELRTKSVKYTATPVIDQGEQMSLREKLTGESGKLLSKVAGILVNNGLGTISPIVPPIVGIGAGVLKIVGKAKTGGLGRVANSPLLEAVMIGGLSQIHLLLGGNSQMARSQPEFIRRIKAKFGMANGGVLDGLRKLFKPRSMSDPRLEVPKLVASSRDVLFGRRT